MKSEIAFLRGIVEADRRDMAEVRAALREALKLAPKQLTAGESSTIEPTPANRSGREQTGAADTDSHVVPNGSGTGTGARERPLTYADIADELERNMRK